MPHDIVERLKAEVKDPSIALELRVLMSEAVGFITEQKQYSNHMRHQIAARIPGDIAQRCDTWSSALSAVSRLKTERNNAQQEVERLKGRDGRWHAAYVKLSSGDIVVDNGDLVGLCATNDLMLEFDAIAGESPAQSLSEIQAAAVEAILSDLKRDMPDTNTLRRIFQRLQLRVDALRLSADQPITNRAENSSQLVIGSNSDRGGSGYDREVLGQNNEGDTVTV